MDDMNEPHTERADHATHFDERAATWDDNPQHAQRATVLAAAIAENLL